MHKDKLNYTEMENSVRESRVQEYMNKYMKELQRHFDMSDKRMRVVLYRIYKETGPLNLLKTIFKTRLSMLQSKYKRFIFKGKNR